MSKFGWSLPAGVGLLPDEQDDSERDDAQVDYEPWSPECPVCHSFKAEIVGGEDEDGLVEYECECGHHFKC